VYIFSKKHFFLSLTEIQKSFIIFERRLELGLGRSSGKFLTFKEEFRSLLR